MFSCLSLLDFSEEECLPSDSEPTTAQEAELQSKRGGGSLGMKTFGYV